MKTTEILEALRSQHGALDRMLAERAALDRSFFPTKTGAVWDAIVLGLSHLPADWARAPLRASAIAAHALGHNAICRLEAEVRGEPFFDCPVCHAVSYHPKDILHGYCGRCHDFTGKPASGRQERP
jgi:hypothetical protein